MSPVPPISTAPCPSGDEGEYAGRGIRTERAASELDSRALASRVAHNNRRYGHDIEGNQATDLFRRDKVKRNRRAVQLDGHAVHLNRPGRLARDLRRGRQSIAVERNQTARSKWLLAARGIPEASGVNARRLRRWKIECLVHVGVVRPRARPSGRRKDHAAHGNAIQAVPRRRHRRETAPGIGGRIVFLILRECSFRSAAVSFAAEYLDAIVQRSASQPAPRA